MKITKLFILFSFLFIFSVNSVFAVSYSITASPGTGGTISPSGTTTVTAGQSYIAPTPYDPGQPYQPAYTDPGQPYQAAWTDPGQPYQAQWIDYGQPYIAPTYHPATSYVAPVWHGTWNNLTYVIDFNVHSTTLPPFLSLYYDSMTSSSGVGTTIDVDEKFFTDIVIHSHYTNTNGFWDSGTPEQAAYTDPGQPYIPVTVHYAQSYIAPTYYPEQPYIPPTYYPGQEYIPPTYYPEQPYIAPTPADPGQAYIAPANRTYTITPNAGYTISSVTVDGVNKGAIGTWTFSNVQANHTISAVFAVSATITDFTAVTPYTEAPSTSISFAYTKPTTSTGAVECRLLNYNKTIQLVGYTTTAPPIVLPAGSAPSSLGVYGYYIHCRNSTYTSVEKYSGLITVNIVNKPNKPTISTIENKNTFSKGYNIEFKITGN